MNFGGLKTATPSVSQVKDFLVEGGAQANVRKMLHKSVNAFI